VQAVSVAANKRDWEELGELDPLWAIAGSAQRRFGRWQLDAFFDGGRREVDRANAPARRARRSGGARGGAGLRVRCRPGDACSRGAVRACGRDRHLRGHAGGARELNADVPNVAFEHNAAADLQVVGERRFDLVYTRIVLQHVAGRDLARSYIREFVRVLALGGIAMFQVPVHIPRRYRLMAVRRLYLAGRSLGIPAPVLYNRLHLHPIRMQWVPEQQVRAWVEEAGGRMRHVERVRSGTGVLHATFFADRP
jgi:SAM-dependent methyltransferase